MSNTRRRFRSTWAKPGRMHGFTMIEVLIAVVVLAIGLLGLALLQTVNLRYTRSADQRTQAINMGNELMDMVRANKTEVAAYIAITPASFSSVPLAPNGCAALTILSAQNNIDRWQCELLEHLGPDATARVMIPALGQLSVEITWIDANVVPLPGAGKITLVTQL